MTITTTRRHFVSGAAGFAALLAAGAALPATVEATPDPAPVVEKSAALRHAEYLVSLLANPDTQVRTGSPAERAETHERLELADRCMDHITNCLDGTFARKIGLAA